MVTTTRQQNAALKELQQWLKNQWPLKQALPEYQSDQLSRLCRRIYQENQHHNQHFPEKNRFRSQPGFEEDQFHSGFLFIGRQAATPLHDHAESFSLSLLLSGAVNIDVYQRIENHQDDISHLEHRETLQLQPGEFSLLPSDHSLIHKLSTGTETACLLDIHYPLFSQNQRYWYLPLASEENKYLLCQRIAEGKFST